MFPNSGNISKLPLKIFQSAQNNQHISGTGYKALNLRIFLIYSKQEIDPLAKVLENGLVWSYLLSVGRWPKLLKNKLFCFSG